MRVNLLANLHQSFTFFVEEDMPDPIDTSPRKKPDEMELNDQFQGQFAMAQLQAQQRLSENVEEKQVNIKKEIETQDNIVEIEINIESDVDGGIDIDRESMHGHLIFMQVPSYQVESSLSDVDMTKELLQRICSVNLRLYR